MVDDVIRSFTGVSLIGVKVGVCDVGVGVGDAEAETDIPRISERAAGEDAAIRLEALNLAR